MNKPAAESIALTTAFFLLLFCILAIIFSGCTLGALADRAAEECEMIVDDQIDEVVMICQDLVDDAIAECAMEIEEAIDGIEERLTVWLLANGCINVGPDQWNCNESPICPAGP